MRLVVFSLSTQTGKLSPKFVAYVGDYPSDMLAFLAYSVFIIAPPHPEKNPPKMHFLNCKLLEFKCARKQWFYFIFEIH